MRVVSLDFHQTAAQPRIILSSMSPPYERKTNACLLYPTDPADQKREGKKGEERGRGRGEGGGGKGKGKKEREKEGGGGRGRGGEEKEKEEKERGKRSRDHPNWSLWA